MIQDTGGTVRARRRVSVNRAVGCAVPTTSGVRPRRAPKGQSMQANSGIDAVRCLYLARIAEQRGHHEAAHRWQQMADDWMARLEPNTDRRGPSSADEGRPADGLISG